MKIYLVGGAVRDSLLGLPVHEKDWVVVEGTPEALVAQGYKPIGKDFPVFLHPETHEEYALARTERKVGHGYKGFEFYAAPTVTLEEDLLRRDLTINAIAQDPAGNIIDPYGGCADLKAKILRPVSKAFHEDPVRVLRLARFAARFHPLGFTIAPEAYEQVRRMREAGELDHLVPERVWQELEQALKESCPQIFFEVLEKSGALATLFPDWPLDADSFGDLAQAVSLSQDTVVRLASLLQRLPAEKVQKGCSDLRCPKQASKLAYLAAQYRKESGASDSLSASALLTLFEKLDLFRHADRFEALLLVWQAGGQSTSIEHLREISRVLGAVRFDDLVTDPRLKGTDLQQAIRERRVEVIEKICHNPSHPIH